MERRTGRWAVFLVFAVNGAAWASWSPRVPAIADQVSADIGTMGLALFGASVGLIVAASFAGRVCARFGARALIVVAALGLAATLPVIALVTDAAQLGVVLALLGAANGAFDVGMNVAAVTVVRITGRPLMPVFHAAFSFGALAGAAGAALAAANGVGLLAHFGVVSTAAVLILLTVVRYVPREARVDGATRRPHGRGLLRRPVLWLLGAIALCSAVVEGASADWSALFAVRDRGMTEAAGAFIYAVFSVAMAFARLGGERLERRWGSERLLVAGALAASGGLLVTVFVPHTATVYAGFALAGAGLAFSFPIALGLAGSVGRRADGTGGEQEIGFVTTIAYAGFLAGPPLIGGIGHLTGLTAALGVAAVIAALIAPAALAAAAARRREEGRPITPATTADSVGG